MAAPIYFQREIEALIKCPKRAVDGGWKILKTRTDKQTSRHRLNEFEATATMAVVPGSPGIKFEIDICHDQRTDNISITLFAAISPRPLRPICRYDIHDNAHPNASSCGYRGPLEGEPHRHVYTENAIRNGDEESCCDCAEPLDIGSAGTPAQLLERLKNAIASDIHLSFDDPTGRSLFVEFPR